MKKLISKAVKAIHELKLIEKGDTVAVGLSGGKDSLLLLKVLAEYRKYNDSDFELIAITINQGKRGTDFSLLQEFCNKLDVPFFVEESDIFEIVFNLRKEKNPCSLCSKMRRGALCNKAKTLGANKVALGHHANDLVETLLLSMMYEGRLSTFSPKTELTKTGITIIRPLVYLTEEEITRATVNFPIFKNPCPANKKTKREDAKNIIKDLSQGDKLIEQNLINSIIHPERYNLWNKK